MTPADLVALASVGQTLTILREFTADRDQLKSALGAFDGRFTGPAAEELMARWTAPYLNPSTQQWKDMFGIMVGKKE